MDGQATEDYFKAVTAGVFQRGVQDGRGRVSDFFTLLKQAEGHLKAQGIEIVWPQDPGLPSNLVLKTSLGDLELMPIWVYDDGFVGAAMQFMDRFPQTPQAPIRKLYAALLKSNGEWVGSDGGDLTFSGGQLTPSTAMKAVLSALAAKLKANTEYVRSF